MVNEDAAPALCRRMAVTAELSARVWQSDPRRPYLCTAVERLRHINALAQRYQTVMLLGVVFAAKMLCGRQPVMGLWDFFIPMLSF